MTVIASIGQRNEIGRQGDLCWHIKEDLLHFKRLTMGGAVVMGRRTWESLPRRPLPGRLNIVVSRRGLSLPEGVVLAASLPEALEAAGECGEVFVIGGASLYSQALPLADTLELTRIHASDSEADTFFPDINPAVWRLVASSEEMQSASGLRFQYLTYRR